MPFPRRKPSRVPSWVWRPRPRTPPKPRAVKWGNTWELISIWVPIAAVPVFIVISHISQEMAKWTGQFRPIYREALVLLDYALAITAVCFVLGFISQWIAMLVSSIKNGRTFKRAAENGFVVCRDCMHPLTHRRGVQRCPECGREQDGMQTRVMWKYWAKVYRCTVWSKIRRLFHLQK